MPRARRGRRDARPGLPARRRAHPRADPDRASDHAVLRDHARPGRHDGPPLHAAADPHPRGGARRGPYRPGHQDLRLPRPLDGQGRGARPDPAGRGPRPDHGLLPDQAHLRQGGPGHERPGLCRRSRARRPRPGRPGAGAPGVPQRQDRRPGRDGRRRPRHRRAGRHARHQLPVPRRRAHLPPPDRPHRPGRRQGRRGDLRRLGRHPQVGSDQQGARPAVLRGP